MTDFIDALRRESESARQLEADLVTLAAAGFVDLAVTLARHMDRSS